METVLSLQEFTSSWAFTWVVLPILIFLARILDVSIGTIRIVFIARGKRRVAPILGFFEVFIWIVVISNLVNSMNSLVAYVAYAGGFAAGNYIGMYIEEKLAIGTLLVRLIVPKGADKLAESLYAAGYGVTSVDAEGSSGPVTLIYTIIKRKDLKSVQEIIQEVNPHAFLTVEEIRSSQEGIFPVRSAQIPANFLNRRSK
jgi:uncharacterized protein YebE (UPF0316 family)